MEKTTVLLGSPIRQSPRILEQFMISIRELNCDNIDLSCLFIDDNDDIVSSSILHGFDLKHPKQIIKSNKNNTHTEYKKDQTSHWWKEELIWRVAALKDFIIEACIDSNFDYLFLADSDLVLSPHTLQRLISTKKQIVSEVFWTSWKPADDPLPQVWQSGQYELTKPRRGAKQNESDILEESRDFVRSLYIPQNLKVGGLGACTLIEKTALKKGARFAEIDNLTYIGEDRHFCVRARALGIELWADTHHPPLHIYRESDLEKVSNYKAFEKRNRWQNPHITLSMLVRNESHRYLREALLHHKSIIDFAVIIDDASTDNTIEIIRECLNDTPHKIIANTSRSFNNEHILRKQQWNETIATNPDWILNLDADEIFEDGFEQEIKKITHQTESRFIGFPLYDMWDPNHFREDRLWNAHQRSWGFLFRYTPFFNYTWHETNQHCGRFPNNLGFHKLKNVPVRIKHLGWSNALDRELKYTRYLNDDPNGKFGSLDQYRSILDPNPRLVAWLPKKSL